VDDVTLELKQIFAVIDWQGFPITKISANYLVDRDGIKKFRNFVKVPVIHLANEIPPLTFSNSPVIILCQLNCLRAVGSAIPALNTSYL